jgi:hypothetical protein
VWAEIYQKLVQTPFFMILNTGIPVLRKFRFKNLQNILFGEGQVQDPIPELLSHGSKIPYSWEIDSPWLILKFLAL